MSALVLLALATLLLACANGANDNFKGVATLFGSGTAGYAKALAWATLTTSGGAVAAVFMAGALTRRFSGEGLVPDALTDDPRFLASVGLAAGVTVLLATLLGFPVSTTHALAGSLAGAGLAAAGRELSLQAFAAGFVLPLVVSPLLAALAAGVLYPLFRSARLRLGVRRDSCLCAAVETPLVEPAGSAAALAPARLEVVAGTLHSCGERYGGSGLAVRAQAVLDAAHWLSAGALSFARGLNDAPKIAALVIASQAAGMRSALVLVSVAMAAGGILGARRVAETMSKRITVMNCGQGFTANLAASALVLFASRLGLPVSTTHVSCGALFGIGTVIGRARWTMIRQILAAWLTTFPLAALVGALAAMALR